MAACPALGLLVTSNIKDNMSSQLFSQHCTVHQGVTMTVRWVGCRELEDIHCKQMKRTPAPARGDCTFISIRNIFSDSAATPSTHTNDGSCGPCAHRSVLQGNDPLPLHSVGIR